MHYGYRPGCHLDGDCKSKFGQLLFRTIEQEMVRPKFIPKVGFEIMWRNHTGDCEYTYSPCKWFVLTTSTFIFLYWNTLSILKVLTDIFSFRLISLLVYRLGYGPFKAEGGVRFPGGEHFLSRGQPDNAMLVHSSKPPNFFYNII